MLLSLLLKPSSAYWDFGTTTAGPMRTDNEPRRGFFRWQRTEFLSMKFWFPNFDWVEIAHRRRLCVIAGISIDLTPLGVATIMNRRTLITSANYLDPHMNRQRMVRIWALGRTGLHYTPYRYRVWRVHRLFPKSNNPEHQHGPRGLHSPRHDLTVIISYDQMYIYYQYPHRYQYAYRAKLVNERTLLEDELFMAGSGYEYMEHIYQNYKIFFALLYRVNVVDCSKYLPKWWGKFICIRNINFFPGIQNGAALIQGEENYLIGVGSFEIRYNEDRIFVFTDLRYYIRWINKYARISPGQYYEYAYPQWGIELSWIYDGNVNSPYIPHKQIRDDLFPLG